MRGIFKILFLGNLAIAVSAFALSSSALADSAAPRRNRCLAAFDRLKERANGAKDSRRISSLYKKHKGTKDAVQGTFPKSVVFDPSVDNDVERNLRTETRNAFREELARDRAAFSKNSAVGKIQDSAHRAGLPDAKVTEDLIRLLGKHPKATPEEKANLALLKHLNELSSAMDISPETIAGLRSLNAQVDQLKAEAKRLENIQKDGLVNIALYIKFLEELPTLRKKVFDLKPNEKVAVAVPFYNLKTNQFDIDVKTITNMDKLQIMEQTLENQAANAIEDEAKRRDYVRNYLFLRHLTAKFTSIPHIDFEVREQSPEALERLTPERRTLYEQKKEVVQLRDYLEEAFGDDKPIHPAKEALNRATKFSIVEHAKLRTAAFYKAFAIFTVAIIGTKSMWMELYKTYIFARITGEEWYHKDDDTWWVKKCAEGESIEEVKACIRKWVAVVAKNHSEKIKAGEGTLKQLAKQYLLRLKALTNNLGSNGLDLNIYYQILGDKEFNWTFEGMYTDIMNTINEPEKPAGNNDKPTTPSTSMEEFAKAQMEVMALSTKYMTNLSGDQSYEKQTVESTEYLSGLNKIENKIQNLKALSKSEQEISIFEEGLVQLRSQMDFVRKTRSDLEKARTKELEEKAKESPKVNTPADLKREDYNSTPATPATPVNEAN